MLKPCGLSGPDGNADWQLWLGWPLVPVGSAETGVARNGSAASERRAAAIRSFDVLNFLPTSVVGSVDKSVAIVIGANILFKARAPLNGLFSQDKPLVCYL